MGVGEIGSDGDPISRLRWRSFAAGRGGNRVGRHLNFPLTLEEFSDGRGGNRVGRHLNFPFTPEGTFRCAWEKQK